MVVMVKKFSFIIFNILIFLDKIFKILTKRSFLIFFNDFIQERSYKSIKIIDKEIKFFCPNQLLKWRVNTYFTKEPETLEWIDDFEKKESLIFWDIGANIGLYSIYNSLKNPKSILDTKKKQDIKAIDTYKPSGNLIYNSDILNSLKKNIN